MPGGLLRPMGPSWTVYFRVGSSGQSQEILYLVIRCAWTTAAVLSGASCLIERVMMMIAREMYIDPSEAGSLIVQWSAGQRKMLSTSK